MTWANAQKALDDVIAADTGAPTTVEQATLDTAVAGLSALP